MQHDSRFPVLHKSFYLIIPFRKNCCLKSAQIRCIIYVKLRICKCWFKKCWFMAWHWLEKPRWFSIIESNGFVLYIVPCLALNALRRAPCHCCVVVAKEWDCFNQGTYAWRELKELSGTKGTQRHELTRKACEDTVQRKLSIVVAAKRKVDCIRVSIHLINGRTIFKLFMWCVSRERLWRNATLYSLQKILTVHISPVIVDSGCQLRYVFWGKIISYLNTKKQALFS